MTYLKVFDLVFRTGPSKVSAGNASKGRDKKKSVKAVLAKGSDSRKK